MMLRCGMWVENTSPPRCTSEPGNRAATSAAWSSRLCFCWSVIEVMVTFSWTLARPARPLSEIRPSTCSLYGVTTSVTIGSSENVPSASVTCPRVSASVSDCPSGNSTTTWAVVAAPDGNVILSWSSATCDEAPGIRKLSLNWAPPTIPTATPRPASTASQTARTRKPWR